MLVELQLQLHLIFPLSTDDKVSEVNNMLDISIVHIVHNPIDPSMINWQRFHFLEHALDISFPRSLFKCVILDEIVGQEIPDYHGKRFLKLIMILREQPLVDEC